MTCVDDSKADLSSFLLPTNISSPYNYVNVIINWLFVERLYYIMFISIVIWIIKLTRNLWKDLASIASSIVKIAGSSSYFTTTLKHRSNYQRFDIFSNKFNISEIALNKYASIESYLLSCSLSDGLIFCYNNSNYLTNAFNPFRRKYGFILNNCYAILIVFWTYISIKTNERMIMYIWTKIILATSTKQKIYFINFLLVTYEVDNTIDCQSFRSINI